MNPTLSNRQQYNLSTGAAPTQTSPTSIMATGVNAPITPIVPLPVPSSTVVDSPIKVGTIGTQPSTLPVVTKSAPYTAPSVINPVTGTVDSYNPDGTLAAPQGASQNGTPSNDNSSVVDYLKANLEKIQGKGAETTQLQNDNQLAQKTQASTDAYNAYNTAKVDLQQRVAAIYDQPGISREQAQQQAAEVFRVGNANLANLAIISQAATGNLQATQQIIKDRLDAEFAPIDDYINYATKYLQLNENDLTESQKIALTEKIKLEDENRNAIRSSKEIALKAAAENGAPASVLAQIDRATTPTEVYTALGQYGSNALDRQYKQAQLANIQSEISTRKAQAEQAANTLPPVIQARVQTVAGQFDNEQAVKNFQTIAETVDSVKNAGKSPTDDIQRVYAVAKVFDPNSAVREGEYKTVQDYATSLLQRVGLKANRVFNNDGFLTDEARKFIDNSLDNRLASSKKAYDNIYKSYGERIDKVTGKSDGTQYITDYSKAFQPDYSQYQSQLKPNEILVKDKSGQIGAIPVTEFDAKLYTKVQ